MIFMLVNTALAAFLDSYRQRLNLDLYFSDHVSGVIQKIKKTLFCVLQCFCGRQITRHGYCIEFDG